GQSAAHFKNNTYTGIGASTIGFSEDNGTFSYWKKYDKFAFETVSGATWASDIDDKADTYFKVTAKTGTATVGTIKIDNSAIAVNDTTKSGASIVLGTEYATQYDFDLTGWDTIGSDALTDADSFNTLTGAYALAGASQAGYLYTDKETADKLTYYAQADSFTLGAASGSDSIKLSFSPDTAGGETLADYIAIDTKKHEVSFTNWAFDMSKLNSGEKLQIINQSGPNTYKLVQGKLQTANDTVGAGFDTLNGVYSAQGARVDSFQFSEDNGDNGGTLTFMKQFESVTLGGTAQFGNYDSLKVDHYFSFKDSVLTINDFSFISNLAEGIEISINSGYTLGFNSSLSAAGTYTAQNTLNASDRIYTTQGMSSVAGFMQVGSTANNFVYHAKSDTIGFGGDLAFATNASNYITVLSAASGSDATVKFAQGAFANNMTDGQSINVTTAGYVLDYSLDGLTNAGTYYANNSLVTLEAGGYAFHQKGAENNGFIADAANSVLAYHTANTYNFNLSGDVSLSSTDSTTLGSYFTFASGTHDGIRDVTVNSALFATTQTAGATLKSDTNTYQLVIDNAVTVNDKSSFSSTASAYSYQGAGAVTKGYTDNNGVITYHDAATAFKFANDDKYDGSATDTLLNFNSTVGVTNFDDWFVVDGNNVTIKSAALSTLQGENSKLSLASGFSNITLSYAEGLIGTYNEDNTFTTVSGGATYRTAGMTGTKGGYVIDDKDSLLTYHGAGTDVSLKGDILFSNTAAASNFTLNSDKTITISKDALAASQTNLATLSASGNYKLVAAFETLSGSDTANMTTKGKYTGAGASTAGYALTNDILKYYDKRDEFSYDGTTALANNIGALVASADSPVKITGTDASGNKIVTFYAAAFQNLQENKTLSISTNGYTASLGADINGGNYDTKQVFYADRKQLKFGGADQDGFVKQNSDDKYYTYRLASNTTPIQFVGTMNFNADINSVEAASDKYFKRIGGGNNITVKIANADIFSPYNNTGDTLTIENKADAAIKYTLQKNGIILVADGTENSIVPEAITANNSGYLYTAWGAKASAGYSDDGAGTLTYYDLSKQIQLNGDIALNTGKLDAIDFGYVTVAGSDASTTSYLKTLTIGKDALADQNVDGTLSIAGSDGYGLALNAADSITAWAHVDETLNNQTYTPEGYSQAGYQVNDNVLSYHSVSSSNITFEGLATGITASVIGYTKGDSVLTLGDAAFGDLTADHTVKVLTGGYTLKLGTGQDASVDVSADLKGPVYTTKGTSAGYELLNNTQINYYAKTGQDSIEFSGLATTDVNDLTVDVSGKSVTLKAAAISTTAGSNTVSVKTANYTFAQGDLTKSVYLDKATLESGVYKTAGYDNTGYSLGSANREISYFAENNADITLSGLKTGASENNIASDSSTTITLSAGALGADVVSIEGATKSGTTADYKLALGSDVGKSVYLAGPTLTSGVYKTAGVDEAGHSLAADGKSISYQAEGNVDITLSGLKEGATADYILFTEGSDVITLKADALGTAVVSIEGATKNGETASFTLALDSGVEKSVYLAGPTLTSGVYKTAGYDNTGYSLAADGKSINYFAENNVDITLSGLKTGATASNILSGTSTVVTLNAGALDTNTVSIEGATKDGTSADFTLDFSGVEKSVYLANATLESDGVYKTAGYDNNGYSLAADSKSINYFAENNEDITLTGLATGTTVDKIGYTAKSAVLALAEAAIGTNNTVSVENSGYTFNLSSVTAANYLATATLSSNKTTYTPEGYTSAGYALGSDSRSIRYQAQTSENITFSGLSTNAAASDITVAGTAITLGQNALGTSDVQVGGNYTLNLADAVNNVYTRTAAQGATYTNSTGIYKNASGPETFTVDGNKATYQSITGGEEITFTGLGSGASTVNVAFDGNSTFTIGSAALGKSSITATGAGTYALKLADADSSGKYIATPADIASYKDNVYTAATTDEFYQASNSSVIAYTEATGGQTATFNGLSSDAKVGDFTFDGNSNFTLAAHALDSTKTASVAGSYKLALGDDVTKSQTLGNQYSNNVFTSSGDTEGYKLSDNKISYTEDTTTKFTFSGVASGATGSSFYLSAGNNQIAIGLAAVDTLGTTLKLTGTPDDGNDYTLRLGKGMTASRTLTEA
ncbi:MAG: hypothetical protein IKN59_03615, partial [Paludibacteraceae bacterium]|nr:hypothetical protein [Paludibacteraceae bacterium]